MYVTRAYTDKLQRECLSSRKLGDTTYYMMPPGDGRNVCTIVPIPDSAIVRSAYVDQAQAGRYVQ